MGNHNKYIHETEVHNVKAPNVVVPLLIEMFKPASVLDVGCGIGTWLNVFSSLGVHDLLGIDDDYVNRELLDKFIRRDQFMAIDLSFPFDLKRKFDLVMSLEVAEHLPESSASGFVASLVKHGNLIIFSAAIPGQGGQNHLNEQWKPYWIDKFQAFGYEAYDLIRHKVWNHPQVDWWYKQNIIVFSNKNLSPMLSVNHSVLEIIHPDLFNQHLDYIIYLQQYVKELEMKVYK